MPDEIIKVEAPPITETIAEFHVDSKRLLEAVKVVLPVINRHSTIPILTQLRIRIVGKAVLVTGTDLKEWLYSTCVADGIKEGSFCIPAHRLQAYLKVCPRSIHFIVTLIKQLPLEDGWIQVDIRSTNGRCAINGLPVSNYPVENIPPAEEAPCEN